MFSCSRFTHKVAASIWSQGACHLQTQILRELTSFAFFVFNCPSSKEKEQRILLLLDKLTCINGTVIRGDCQKSRDRAKAAQRAKGAIFCPANSTSGAVVHLSVACSVKARPEQRCSGTPQAISVQLKNLGDIPRPWEFTFSVALIYFTTLLQGISAFHCFTFPFPFLSSLKTH